MISQIEAPNAINNKDNNKDNSTDMKSIFDGGSLWCFGKGEHGRLGIPNYTNKQCNTPNYMVKI